MLRIILVVLFSVAGASGQYCNLVGAMIVGQDKDYSFLGMVSFNQYDTASIMNPYGNYGSKFSATSIFNTFGDFGSQFSDVSPMNKFANKPPAIVAVVGGEVYLLGMLSLNKFALPPAEFSGSAPVIDPEDLVGFLKFGSCQVVAARNLIRPKMSKRGGPVFDLLGRQPIKSPRELRIFQR
jgi:hypothetical protein